MTTGDVVAFAEAMHVLGQTFSEPVSDVRVEAYFDALMDMPIEAVTGAVRLALRTCKFFPRPVELRELITGDATANADAAWGELVQQIQRVGYMGLPTFTDERTERAIKETWGSWRRLCETLPAEGPELIGWMKQFKGAFQSLDKRDTTELLTGATLHPSILAFIHGEQKRIGS